MLACVAACSALRASTSKLGCLYICGRLVSLTSKSFRLSTSLSRLSGTSATRSPTWWRDHSAPEHVTSVEILHAYLYAPAVASDAELVHPAERELKRRGGWAPSDMLIKFVQ